MGAIVTKDAVNIFYCDSRTSVVQVAQAGVAPLNTNAALSELRRPCRRTEAAEIVDRCALASPNCRSVIENFRRVAATRWQYTVRIF